MSEWRTKPRTGKAEFLKHLAVIQARLAAGETQNAVRVSLTDASDWSISAAQFSRYVKAHTSPAKSRREVPVINEPKTTLSTSPAKADMVQATERKPLTPADFKRIRAQTDNLDLSALIESNSQ
ncbi:MAG: hypothetical protein EOP06_04470 [Proteobacteria bacterium]|nr:MAG: hypothetical protein EOP06_04470 [Pseudomonadota bacterium]